MFKHRICRDPITAAIIIGGVVGGAAIGVSSSKAKKAEKKAAAQAAENKQAQDTQLSELKQIQAEEKAGTEKAKANATAKLKQKQKAAAASGKTSTILTGPLGVPGDADSGTVKTILGA